MIHWISQAWNEIKPDTIAKCFKNAGILTAELNVSIIDEEDRFQDIDAGLHLYGLVAQTMGPTTIVPWRGTSMETMTVQCVPSLMMMSGRRDFYTA